MRRATRSALGPRLHTDGSLIATLDGAASEGIEYVFGGSNSLALNPLGVTVGSNPDIEITLVEGCCMVCDPCDGYDTKTDRCVHGGGLIRDYKKDLDVLQKLGLMTGATMKARDLYKLLFERIPSTKEVCAYGDGVLTSNEWRICGGREGSEAYKRTVEKGII